MVFEIRTVMKNFISMKAGPLIDLMSFALQSFAIIGHFFTFPGVGGAKLRLKTISAKLKLKFWLSLAIKDVASNPSSLLRCPKICSFLKASLNKNSQN